MRGTEALCLFIDVIIKKITITIYSTFNFAILGYMLYFSAYVFQACLNGLYLDLWHHTNVLLLLMMWQLAHGTLTFRKVKSVCQIVHAVSY